MPSGGGKHLRSVQPAAVDDKRSIKCQPLEGRQLQGEAVPTILFST